MTRHGDATMAERIGLEVESVAAPYSGAEWLLGRASPALIAVPRTVLQFAVVLGATRRHLRVVAPAMRFREQFAGLQC